MCAVSSFSCVRPLPPLENWSPVANTNTWLRWVFHFQSVPYFPKICFTFTLTHRNNISIRMMWSQFLVILVSCFLFPWFDVDRTLFGEKHITGALQKLDQHSAGVCPPPPLSVFNSLVNNKHSVSHGFQWLNPKRKLYCGLSVSAEKLWVWGNSFKTRYSRMNWLDFNGQRSKVTVAARYAQSLSFWM